MRLPCSILCLLPLLASAPVLAQPAETPILPPVVPLSAPWNEGAADCAAQPQPPLEVHAYDAHTYILRENLCTTTEAPFMYLLIGSAKALLIDTGDVADPAQMPLAQTVFKLLPGEGAYRMPLLVVHTHRHLDHRAGDPQFEHQPKVHVVPYDFDGMRQYFGFGQWPEGQAQIDLGDRIVDVIPAPGHNPTEVVFYDRGTTLLFSGDFLLPGRLLIEDSAADLASAQRVAAFVEDRPVAAVLGGHVEFDAQGGIYLWNLQHHPREHLLPLGKNDLLGLPDALSRFNGFFTSSGPYMMMNPMRVLAALAGTVLLVVLIAAFLLVRWVRRRWRAWRQRRKAASA
jgi:hydroxyacylglutathione hydrolase